ncbi:Tryptophan 2,3-dioxygenase [Galdieria sulphuraria]|uniref:Tryptophan 2,3-dioxygenase n=1 Tax=Galdieria sulphuraria TaxID=130081 RepID=M2WXW9_GALSU|nr:tryptophan 2,3-dioxygenase [Galdieria sulphuraria]EME28900.1 tryptophan 2,3-dioxygenase [Galdieria sulphuraria]GJD08289.1 Tryptophan 2,3-dioxygenase [Galdieria sulphuraria]|eukprot:XP_005705420.1 tryptophan 2,3-dioxygenase [Galdieria sulphuraria]
MAENTHTANGYTKIEWPMSAALDTNEERNIANGPFCSDITTRNNVARSQRTQQYIRHTCEPQYYSDYLQLDNLLSCQAPVTERADDKAHDETLFIIVHQVFELWFKQILIELDSIIEILSSIEVFCDKRLALVLHRLNRIKEIEDVMIRQIEVIQTITPQEFLDFRDYLFPASGFQSFQFRLFEEKLGIRNQMRPNEGWFNSLRDEHKQMIHEAERAPCLFEVVEKWLQLLPFREFRGYNFSQSYKEATDRMLQVDESIIEQHYEGEDKEKALRELERTKKAFQSAYDRATHEHLIQSGQRRLGFRATGAALLIMLYEDEPMLHTPALILRAVVDVEDKLNLWRYRHAQMVRRMIGGKVGTGGSVGHAYLRSTVDRYRVFGDLANVSTLLIPRRLLPELPSELREQLTYYHRMEKLDRTFFDRGGSGESLDDL